MKQGCFTISDLENLAEKVYCFLLAILSFLMAKMFDRILI